MNVQEISRELNEITEILLTERASKDKNYTIAKRLLLIHNQIVFGNSKGLRKTCSKCKLSAKDGYLEFPSRGSICTACLKKKQSEYYSKNKEKWKDYLDLAKLAKSDDDKPNAPQDDNIENNIVDETDKTD